MITAARIAAIAARYDLSPNDKLVVENATQAVENHGKPRMVNGRLQASWGTDNQGYYDAARLLDGYLAEETRVMRCDALAARQFECDAY